MATAPKRRSEVHEAAGTRVWCGLERRTVPVERCVTCVRLSDVVVRDGVRYIRCRSDASPDDPPSPAVEPPPSDATWPDVDASDASTTERMRIGPDDAIGPR